MKAIFSKVMLVGVAELLTATMGVATTAVAGTGVGSVFNLGTANTVDKITKLIGSVPGAMLRIDNNGGGSALDLQVEPGAAPMSVNSGEKVTNLNADKVDGKSADQIGVNGVEVVASDSATSSESPKIAIADCPEGKAVMGSGFDIESGTTGAFPTAQTDVVVNSVDFFAPGDGPPDRVVVEAFEEQPTSASWSVRAKVICATAS